MASEQLDAAVVASTLAQEDGCRVLHIVRLRTSYACSACWSFPPLTTNAGAPRYVVVYAAAARSLLGEGLRCTRNALTADGRTLDTPAAEPRDLGGALVAFIEVGVLGKDLLRPSPRHFFVLNGEAGEAVFSTPEGDALRAAVTDPTLGVVTSRAFKLKLVGIANGFVRKLRGLAMPRVARKAARRGGGAEPTAERLLEALPIADVLAHLELCQSWLTLATNGNHSYVGHLQELRDRVARALEPGVSVPSVGLASYLDQWLAATTAAMPAADKSTETKDTERSAQICAIVANSLLTIREADLESFAADHPEAVGAGEISEQGLSVRLRSLLQMLDPHGLLPPHQIVFAVQSGSAMYNLATATSDEDYLLVFVRSPGELLAFEPPADQIEFKGETLRFGEDKGGVVEGSAMELGRYVSLLCKGNPMVLEPLYVASDGVLHSSAVWHELQELRHRCLFTRRAARQYLGFVDDRLRKARKALEVEGELKAASKYLYHGMHKLAQLRSILAGDEPRIYLPPDDGPESDRERIMRVRRCVCVNATGDAELQGARAEMVLSTELKAASGELARLQQGAFDALVESFPEDVDFESLDEWLLSVRTRIHRQQAQGISRTAPDDGRSLSRQKSVPSIAPALTARQVSSGSDASSAAADNTRDDATRHDVSDEDESQYVCSVLSQFQRDERVRLVFAAERSSRSYGWAHSGSDHDILAIFVCDRREYFGLSPVRRAASREYPAANGQCAVGIYGWELKHACGLALASNPTLLDGLRSPMIYVDLILSSPNGLGSDEAVLTANGPPDTWGHRMLQMALAHYDQRTLAQSYLSNAKKDLHEQVQRCGGDGPKRKKYLNIFRALLSSHALLRSGEVQPFPLAADEGVGLRAGCQRQERRDWPPLNLRDLLAQADEALITKSARKILDDWLSPSSLASGLPGLPVASNEPAALELERCIDAIADQLHGPIKAALPPKHWRSKGEVRWVEREVARREAATQEFGTLCEELLEAETRFSS